MPSEPVGPGAVSSFEILADRYRMAVFALLAVFAGAALFFGARGYAPVVGVAGLLFAPLALKGPKDPIGFGLLAALIAWAAASVFWSPVSDNHPGNTTLHLGLQLLACASLASAAAGVDRTKAERALLWLAFGLLAGAAVVAVEMVSHAALYRALSEAVHQSVRPDLAIRNLAQSGDVVAVLVWPAGLALRRRGWPLAALALAAFVPACLILLRGFAPSLGLLLSVPVFFWVLKSGRPAINTLMGLTAAYMLLTPWILLGLNRGGAFTAMADHLPASWAVRSRIWTFVSDRLLDHPFWGSGLDASRAFPEAIPLHPHDGPLQLWFELGVPGVLLGTAFWAWIFVRLGRRAQTQRLSVAIGAAVATVYLAIGAVGFGLWQEWWLCVGALGLTCCILAGKFADERAA